MIYKPAEDSFLLEKYVKKYAIGGDFLDIGSGSGIQALAAREAGAKSVLATDINEEAIQNLKKKNIGAIKSNLFLKIKGKFDLIVFNPPYLPEDKREEKESREATTGGKIGDEMIIKFIKQAPKHLTKKGFILLIVSSLTPKKRIDCELKKQKLVKKILERENLFFEYLEVWKLSFS